LRENTFLKRIIFNKCLMIIVFGIGISLLGFSAKGEASICVKGETIGYDIKKFGLKVGEASIQCHGKIVKNKMETELVVFTANALNFFDEEKIYLDPQTALPTIIERDLNMWGKKEKITEIYDQKNFKVKIVKNVGGKISEMTIEKSAPIENIYGFLYRYRSAGRFQEGETLYLNLPTKEVAMKLRERVHIEALGKDYNSFLLQSDSKKYQIWFEGGMNRIPLRIDGAIGIGKTAMIISSYNGESQLPAEIP